MKIIAKKIKVNDDTFYKYFKPKYCCIAMEKNPMIDIYNEYSDNYLCKGCESLDCIGCEFEDTGRVFGMFLSEEIEVYDWGDSWPENYFYPIKYCPFCGEPIEIEITETIDKTVEVELLENELSKLRKQLWSCDSKKKCSELEKRIRSLSEIVEYYYMTGEIDEDTENQGEIEK